jgi:phosphatidylserine decarboxylase
MNDHVVYNRGTRKLEKETSGNVNSLAFLYNSIPGKILNPFIARHFVSRTYGRYVRSTRSSSKIPAFIEQYNISISDLERSYDSFISLNDFFMRKLRPESRPIDHEPMHLISPADSRLFVFELTHQHVFPVKGYWYSLAKFLKSNALSKQFADGWCFVYRLAPGDYHRFCFVDNGWQEQVKRIKGRLHSVNPIALSSVKSLMARNYRELTVLHTENFDNVLHIEVGALMVGKVVLVNRHAVKFKKGEEKGWFEFGGSTIVQLFKRNTIIPDKDILIQSASGIETLVKMGERVACSACN